MFICVRPAAHDARIGWSRLDDAVSIGKQLRFGGVYCLHLEGSYIPGPPGVWASHWIFVCPVNVTLYCCGSSPENVPRLALNIPYVWNRYISLLKCMIEHLRRP